MTPPKPTLGEADPSHVLLHFGSMTVFALATIAYPFVPEAIFAVALYLYLRHFFFGYRLRLWRAPARVSLALGAQKYRDATTRTWGDANWPLGVAPNGAVWLRREDLLQGLALVSEDLGWQNEATGVLMLGACLNQTGALVVQPLDAPPIVDRLTAITRPFGRDAELIDIDLAQPNRPILKITTSTIARTAASLNLGSDADTLLRLLLPVLSALGTLGHRNPLGALSVLDNPKNLKAFIDLKTADYDASIPGRASNPAPSDAVLNEVLAPIRALDPARMEAGRQALWKFGQELAKHARLSLTNGLDLTTMLHARALVCIRPNSPLIAALLFARMTEAMEEVEPGSHGLVHTAWSGLGGPKALEDYRAAALRAGALGSIALPDALLKAPPRPIGSKQGTRKDKEPPAEKLVKATVTALNRTCLLVTRYRAPRRPADHDPEDLPPPTANIVSKLKDCEFVLDLQLVVTDPEEQEPDPVKDTLVRKRKRLPLFRLDRRQMPGRQAKSANSVNRSRLPTRSSPPPQSDP